MKEFAYDINFSIKKINASKNQLKIERLNKAI